MVASAGCDPDRITVTGRLPGLLAELGELQGEKVTLDADITATSTELGRLNDIARQECNGTPGTGLSRRVGVGVNCTRNRQEADEYATAKDLPAMQTRQTQLGGDIVRRQQEIAGAQVEYRAQRDTSIRGLVAERRSHQREIGLLERLEALGKLTGSHPHLRFAEWAIRIFFVLIDCLPVLVKLFSGTTRYERLVDDRLVYGERRHRRRLQVMEYRDEKDALAEKDKIDESHRRRSASRDAEMFDDIDRLTERLLARPPSPAAPTGGQGPGRR
ncbi:protein of unknown function (DUF4407) [Frankia sp. EI5c]|uniref:DUF4407 domain-containing protein n=1 Tax=Frankia sp. EI5c TaxID=683316 RepID=UPI0007C3DB8F|nr:protein of unknown function (DUF4407) [Frankia sp. EI5c]